MAANKEALNYLNSIGVKYQVHDDIISVDMSHLRVSQYKELLYIVGKDPLRYEELKRDDEFTVREFDQTFDEK